MPVPIRIPLIFLLLLTVTGLVSGQESGPARIQVSGEIRDSRLIPVSYAHIVIKNRPEGVVGDYYGNFRIGALPGDTLVISAVSYHNAYVPVPQGFNRTGYNVSITLQSDTINLAEVVVHPWPATLERLRREVLNHEPEDPLANLDLHLPSPAELKMLAAAAASRTPGMVTITAPGPISLFYDRFSKEARQKKAYAEVMKKEQAGKRYNAEVIARVTGFKDPEEIKKFTDFCKLELSFILEASDYDLYAAITNCYKAYRETPADTLSD